MKKCIITSILIACSALGSLLAQINNNHINYQEKNTEIRIPNLRLPNYTDRFTITFQPFQLTTFIGANNINLLNRNTLFDFNSRMWTGYTHFSQFKLNNVPIKTSYQFDMNGIFQNSSMSIKLNK